MVFSLYPAKHAFEKAISLKLQAHSNSAQIAHGGKPLTMQIFQNERSKLLPSNARN
jgi:hypothetical protein